MRVAVIERIRLGKRPYQIAEELYLSRQTINAIRKTANKEGYRSYRERGKTERKKKIYSVGPEKENKKKYRGRPHKTKYGTVYLP